MSITCAPTSPTMFQDTLLSFKDIDESFLSENTIEVGEQREALKFSRRHKELWGSYYSNVLVGQKTNGNIYAKINRSSKCEDCLGTSMTAEFSIVPGGLVLISATDSEREKPASADGLAILMRALNLFYRLLPQRFAEAKTAKEREAILRSSALVTKLQIEAKKAKKKATAEAAKQKTVIPSCQPGYVPKCTCEPAEQSFAKFKQ